MTKFDRLVLDAYLTVPREPRDAWRVLRACGLELTTENLARVTRSLVRLERAARELAS